MEVHGQLKLGADLPERVPRSIRKVRAAYVVGVRGHVDTPHAQVGHSAGLGGREAHVPSRKEGHREQPVVRFGLDLGHDVVVHLDNREAQFGIAYKCQVLPTETERAREDDLGIDTGLVHDLEAHLGVVGADMDVLDPPLVQPELGRYLLAVTADDRRRRGHAHGVAVKHPMRDAVDLFHPGNPIPELGRRPLRKEIVGFRPVAVGVDYERIFGHGI